jgi:antitoxin ParD1/3/4
MPTRTSMNVSLTPELEQFVQSRVASGLFQTASEVVREGLRLLEEREQAREAALAELRARIRRGIEGNRDSLRACRRENILWATLRPARALRRKRSVAANIEETFCGRRTGPIRR